MERQYFEFPGHGEVEAITLLEARCVMNLRDRWEEGGKVLRFPSRVVPSDQGLEVVPDEALLPSIIGPDRDFLHGSKPLDMLESDPGISDDRIVLPSHERLDQAFAGRGVRRIVGEVVPLEGISLQVVEFVSR